MKNLKSIRNLFNLHAVAYVAVFGCLFFGSLQMAYAQTTTFAQFFEQNGTQDFVFTNNTTSATFNTVSGGSPIFFIFQNIAGLNAALTGPQSARLTITTTTTTPASLVAGSDLRQPLNQVITITILRDTAAPVGNGTRRNLITAVITPNTNTPAISGPEGGSSAALPASFSPTSPDNNVTFSSDFVNFSNTTARNLGLTFTSVTPQFALGAGSFMQSFTAAGSGSFASNPVPVVVGPTASVVTVGGRVLTPSGRGLRNAQVTVTQADGSTRTILTGVYGTYSFTDLVAGQTIILSVRSKSYQFAPQIITPGADLTGIDFIPEAK